MTITLNTEFEQLEDWKWFEKQLLQKSHFMDSSLLFKVLNDPVQISSIWEQTDKFIDFVNSGMNESFNIFCTYFDYNTAFNKHLTYIQKHQVLSFFDLNPFFSIAEFFQKNHKQFKEVLSPYYSFDFTAPPQFLKTLKEFRSLYSIEGVLDYNGHPVLAQLSLKKKSLEQNIRKSLLEYNTQSIPEKLQNKAPDLMNGKYIIAVKSDSYSKNIGTIVSRSDSGQTLYVEPFLVKDNNYQLAQIEAEIFELINKFESNFSRFLSENFNFIQTITRTFLLVDNFSTRALFAIDLDLTKPVLKNKCGMYLTNAFYPLIENPVKNDILLSEAHSGLIISGPNTGGKSVTLKILYLSQLLTRLALYLPAFTAEIYIFEKVSFFSGDKQDIKNSLSSFAAEVQLYRNLFNQIGDSNLIIIDEIFNTTSSEEASALAMGLFVKLASCPNTQIAISTHHQTLKTLLHAKEEYISAHVSFDTENLNPTYKLISDSPGSSHAIDIFSKLTTNSGLSDVSRQARHYLDNNVIHYEKLLSNLAQKEHELDKELKQARQLTFDLKQQSKKSEGLLRLQRAEAIKAMEKDHKKFLKDLESKADSLSKKQFQQISSESKRYISRQEQDKKPTSDKRISPKEFQKGSVYFSELLQTDVILTKIFKPNKLVQIQHRGKSISCDPKTLKVSSRHRLQNTPVENFHYTPSVETKLEYDCRGMRLGEFESLIENIASHLLAKSIPFAIIIHGHGTGTLKNYLKTYIKNHPDLCFDSDDSGNDGQSRVTLC